MRTAKKCDGIIADINYQMFVPGRADTVVVIKCKFNDAEGHEHTTDMQYPSENLNLSVGESVPVLYNPAYPEQARMSTPFQVWVPTALAGIFGAVFTLGSISIFLKKEQIF